MLTDMARRQFRIRKNYYKANWIFQACESWLVWNKI